MQTDFAKTNQKSRILHGPATAFLTAVNDYLNRQAEENLRAETIAAARQVLRKSGEKLNNPSLNTITPSHLEAIIHDSTRPQLGNRRHYVILQRFYRWLVQNGYLPKADFPMANIRPPEIPAVPCEILTVSEARSALRLLASGPDPKTAAFLAVNIFSGIRSTEMERLGPSDIEPGVHILMRTEWSVCRNQRHIPILPVLDEWLRPFYGHTEQLFSFRARMERLQREFRARGLPWKRNFLRHTFCSYRLALTQDPALTAADTGSPFHIFTRYHRGLTTSAEAKRFFALSPEACGIPDWNNRVAKDFLGRDALSII